MEYIVNLSDGVPNINLLGGKGSNIVNLIKIGVNVPSGFIVNTNSYKRFLKESDSSDKLKEIMSRDFISKDIISTSAEIKELIMGIKIPKEIVDELRVAYDQICEKTNGDLSFAVRSSATIEDSGKFSFAGQADSFLYNKTFKEILISLKLCWVSLFSPRAMLYFLQMRKKEIYFSLLDIQMAVVVQKMVNSEISGVLFTANVIDNNEKQMMINSTWGLGETIANDLVNSDTIIINKNDFKIIRTIIGEKKRKSIQNPKASGTIMIDTASASQFVCSLNEKQLRQIHNLGLKIEHAFQYPQDIEWAIEKGILYTLQSRPITTLRKN